MKFSSVGHILLSAALATALSAPAAVYDLSNTRSDSYLPHVSKNAGSLFLADQLALADNLAVSEQDIADLNELYGSAADLSEKPKLLVSVSLVEDPAAFFPKLQPSFYIEHGGPGNKYFQKLSKVADSARRMTKEITAIAPELALAVLDDAFSDFESKMVDSWRKFANGRQQGPIELKTKDSRVPRINDKHFINDLVSLTHLAQARGLNASSVVVANIHSLVSVARKLGTDASSYTVSKRALEDAIRQLGTVFDVFVVVKPAHKHTGHHGVLHLEHLEKRGRELEEAFLLFSKRADSACFTSEDACNSATNKCSSHGECKKLQGDCWLCVCKSSFDKSKSKTTKWTGTDCSRKDVLSAAHLLLWTLVALLAALVGGTKLLVSIGSDPLPGVLDAATTIKKSS